jgi:O-acetylserine/cysteine efflux transporter
LNLVLCVLALAYGGTVFGYGVWARLLAHHSAATVTPFALLVPVVGMVAASIVFGEPLRPIELFGGVLVMAGLALNVFGDRLLGRRTPVLR